MCKKTLEINNSYKRIYPKVVGNNDTGRNTRRSSETWFENSENEKYQNGTSLSRRIPAFPPIVVGRNASRSAVEKKTPRTTPVRGETTPVANGRNATWRYFFGTRTDLTGRVRRVYKKTFVPLTLSGRTTGARDSPVARRVCGRSACTAGICTTARRSAASWTARPRVCGGFACAT